LIDRLAAGTSESQALKPFMITVGSSVAEFHAPEA
jgi:hypothetical protein